MAIRGYVEIRIWTPLVNRHLCEILIKHGAVYFPKSAENELEDRLESGEGSLALTVGGLSLFFFFKKKGLSVIYF